MRWINAGSIGLAQAFHVAAAVIGTIEDSASAGFEAVRESALTMQQGGGIGCDFSRLRPGGDLADDRVGVASGPVSSMRVWNDICAALLTIDLRRGAIIATLSCDHPDIEQFIEAKADAKQLRHFNLSVLISDAFMRALAADGEWALVFPCAASEASAHAGSARRRARGPARRRKEDAADRVASAACSCPSMPGADLRRPAYGERCDTAAQRLTVT